MNMITRIQFKYAIDPFIGVFYEIIIIIIIIIGRRGFIQQKKVAKIRFRLVGVASFHWPRQIMIVQSRAYQLQKRSASYVVIYKLVIVPVHS